jgi:2-keto-4-pentenoate hydratase/2-oxohepta-3-ene-1,7-dioic acid hydratase in catechol pathway
MKLAMFGQDGALRIGVVEGDEVIDLRSADARLPADVGVLLQHGDEALQAAAAAAAAAQARRYPLAAVRLAAPIPHPRKFLGLGQSFTSQIADARAKGLTISQNQVWFNKQVSAVNGPYDPIFLPRGSDQLDYEGEVAIVIGKRARHVKKMEAAACIAGFMVCNDVTIRDWQRRAPTATLGKSYDTHGPIGPWLTTSDEVAEPDRLRIRTWVDGQLRQDGSTAELVYSFGEMIEELSGAFTLEPGDVLATGTPMGVGALMQPPRFLDAGQVVRIEVSGLGHIENQVIPEPD